MDHLSRFPEEWRGDLGDVLDWKTMKNLLDVCRKADEARREAGAEGREFDADSFGPVIDMDENPEALRR